MVAEEKGYTEIAALLRNAAAEVHSSCHHIVIFI